MKRQKKTLSNAEIIQISTVSYMELLQGARDKKEIRSIRNFIKTAGIEILPLTENIGHRASIYMEEYCLKVDMCMADAIIAATATENQIPICTGNQKHYKPVTEIEINTFRP